ncbi:tyrosine-type recombinase/integrase [Paenibacillus pinistramenti]|uniref:tyrosine-type recombinase/integrase n=1 Tax=Paenibacillus pinistramenti TaxID=1768003 RepID=UPI001107CDF7|nr:site-specific integrase [Paenibacillus pinistramenti]
MSTKHVLSVEECQLLLEVAKKSDHFLKMGYVLCKTMLRTGLRNSEVVQLTYSQIDLEQNVIHIKKDNKINGSIIPIDCELADELIQYLSHPAYLRWISSGKEQVFFIKDKPFDGNSLTIFIKELAFKAGIKKIITPRNLRYTFAYTLKTNNFSPLEMKELLRLDSMESVSRYLFIPNHYLRLLK